MKLTDNFLEPYRVGEIPEPFGPLGAVVYARTYSRDGERWVDTCQRVVEECFRVQREHCDRFKLPWKGQKAQASAKEMFDRMYRGKFLPAGRGLFSMGTDYVRNRSSAALFNCCFVSTLGLANNPTSPFEFMADMLMLGVGVGFDTLGEGSVKVNAPKEVDEVYTLEDSKEGWVEGIRETIGSYLCGTPLRQIDFSAIRPAGSPILGYGGVAPGPEPLIKGLKDMRRVLDAEVGKMISVATIVDLMNLCGRIVVAGGVRRSAQIALGEATAEYLNLKDPEDPRMLEWRWASNNSVYGKPGQDYTEIADRIAKNGEPGVVWLNNARYNGRMGEFVDDGEIMGVNPCVTGDTEIMVVNKGPVRIDQLEDGELVYCLDDEGSLTISRAIHPRITGYDQPIYSVLLDDGSKFKVTGNHKFLLRSGDYVEAKDLREGDSLSMLNQYQPDFRSWSRGDQYINFSYRDSIKYEHVIVSEYAYGESNGRHINHLDEDKTNNAPENLRYENEFEHLSSHSCGEGNPRYIDITNEELINKGADFCKHLGRRFSQKEWFKFAKENGLPLGFSKFRKDVLGSIRDFSVTCCNVAGIDFPDLDPRLVRSIIKAKALGLKTVIKDRRLFVEKTCEICDKPFTVPHYRREVMLCSPECIGKKRRKKLPVDTAPNHKVVSVTYIGTDTVWNATVENHHNLFMACRPTKTKKGRKKIAAVNCANCGELFLTSPMISPTNRASGELCNLISVFPSKHDTLEDFKRTVKSAYLYGKTVTLLPTHREEVNAIIMRNRRIGLSMGGIVQAITQHGYREFISWCDATYEYTKALDKIYSDWLCIPRSIKMTTVVPSGTTSHLAGVTPGIHFAHSEYYYRTIRIDKNSAVLGPLREAGYRVEESLYNDNAYIVYFPIKEQDFDRAKDEVSMWEQLELAAQMQEHWADNGVSVTVTFKPEEAKDIAHALSMYETRLKAVSFLPLVDHQYKQAPYITIDKEEYERAISTLKPLDLSSVVHEADEKFCNGESCEVTK